MAACELAEVICIADDVLNSDHRIRLFLILAKNQVKGNQVFHFFDTGPKNGMDINIKDKDGHTTLLEVVSGGILH